MNHQGYYYKMMNLCKLIEQEGTGTAEEIALKIGISRRTVFRYLNELRDSGAMIKFSKQKNTFLFEEEFCIMKDFLNT